MAKGQRTQLIWGVLLIVFGLLAFAGQFIDFDGGSFGIFIPLALGIIFLIWGIISREGGLLIPGGILFGVGLGIVMIAGPWGFVSDEMSGGVFMLCFALGWALITVLTAVFTDETHWWPLIPGGIMAIIGGGILFGGVFWSLLTFIGKAWPLVLIAVGIYVLLKGRNQEKPPENLVED